MVFRMRKRAEDDWNAFREAAISCTRLVKGMVADSVSCIGIMVIVASNVVAIL